MKRELAACILAAGAGTRMKSDIPKVLHPLCGRPMLGYLLDQLQALGLKKIYVVSGFKSELVESFVGKRAKIVRQSPLLGSGHAVDQLRTSLKDFGGDLLVLYGDTPLLTKVTLQHLIDEKNKDSVSGVLLSVFSKNPTGYGRIIRDQKDQVTKIVEEADASVYEKAIEEVNVGAYCFDSKALFESLLLVKKNLQKKEYFLTDSIAFLSKSGRVTAFLTPDADEVLGVNSRVDLARVEWKMQSRILNHWMEEGVTIRDPRSVTIDAETTIGRDTVILPHTSIEGGCRIGSGCRIGPFARLRQGVILELGVEIGNFVEVVRSRIGSGTKIKHLSYIGDAEVGREVNIGAGTITANYDGKNKHKTFIKDRAQIGSGTILIAPLMVGCGAKTGAGAVVPSGRDVPNKQTVVGVPAKALKKKGGAAL